LNHFLKFLALCLMVAGTPLFVILAVFFGAVVWVNPPTEPDKQFPRFMEMYRTLALSGLLLAAGGILWCVSGSRRA
jgi:hypothetical protein